MPKLQLVPIETKGKPWYKRPSIHMDVSDILDIMITAHILKASNELKIYRKWLPILKEKIEEDSNGSKSE